MDEDTRFQELKEKEIQRLINEEGKANPVKGILTDDEILKYAGDSRTASEIRLKRGIGTQSDKSWLHDDMYVGIIIGGMVLFFLGIVGFTLNNFVVILLFFLILFFIVGYYIYVMHIKDYTEPEYKQITEKLDKFSSKKDEDEKISSNDELLLLFESKEKIAREMVEKKFPAPQLTNTKFNTVIDDCKKEVESQILVLNALTVTEKTKYEIESRKDLIKQLINKMDDLTNELILSDENHIEEAIEDMDDLINSVKEYE